MVELEVETKRITRVRVEYADGTFSELDDPEECRKWHEMILSQAANAYVHGQPGPTLTWKHGELPKPPAEKFCIMHGDDGVLCMIDGREMWDREANAGEIIIFDTQGEARGRIDAGVKGFPNSKDWPRAAVGRFLSSIPPTWERLPE